MPEKLLPLLVFLGIARKDDTTITINLWTLLRRGWAVILAIIGFYIMVNTAIKVNAAEHQMLRDAAAKTDHKVDIFCQDYSAKIDSIYKWAQQRRYAK